MYEENILVNFLEGNDYTHIEFRYDKTTKTFKLVAIGDDETNIIISFCPMCGRKLGGDN